MASRRTLFVDHAAVLGGAELYLRDVARSFGDNATVLLFQDGPLRRELESESVRVEVLHAPAPFLDVEKTAGMWTALSALPGFASLVRDVRNLARDHEVVVANSQKALVAAGPASWWADRPFVWILHDLLTANHFSSFSRGVASLFARAFADRVIVNSNATKEAFARAVGDASRCRLVYNGFDADRFDLPAGDVRGAVYGELGLPADTPTVGVFGRLAPWKGQHVMIDALQELPRVHAVFVGDTLFDADNSYRDDLRRRADTHDVRKRVHFLGFRDDVPRLMHAVDVVAHTSVQPEPFGRVVVEGMLSETPVVATRAGGPTEIINEANTGLLVPPGNAGALATAIQSLVSNPERARSMGRAARIEAAKRFSIGRMQRDVNEVVDAVARERASAGTSE